MSKGVNEKRCKKLIKEKFVYKLYEIFSDFI